MAIVNIGDVNLKPRPANKKQSRQEEESLHVTAFGVVYANGLARRAMEEKTPVFPQGSIIVRERLSSETSQAPELLTVMVKREKGFNPTVGDWQFLVMDGAAKRVLRRETTGSCSSCHASRESTDFVFRMYLPKNAPSKTD